MPTPAALLARLEAIGASLAASGQALALIGLGSVGQELARLDAYSDLDFFAVVQPGSKARYLESLDWLSGVAPVAYAFRNTADGFKLLYADGIFCEFAVFEPHELAVAAYAPGRLIWKAPGVPDSWAVPAQPAPAPPARSTGWLLGEALTNLYVGLGRYRRGEKLIAARFIQHYAVDRVLELASRLETEQPAWRDDFSIERRFEARFPHTGARLPDFIQGYDRSPQSALAVLAFLESHFEVNPALAAQIRLLAERL